MKHNILVVDDEPVARQSLTEILRLEGYNVSSIANGQSAVEFIRSEHVDLMIVDLRMPGMDGLEVIRVVNQISPDTEIVLLTAFSSTESAVEALRLRIHDYLMKPAAPSQVLNSVKRGLARRAARVQALSEFGKDVDVDGGVKAFELADHTFVDLARRIIHREERVIHLTPAEGRLLKIFFENPGKVFTHKELVLLVQGYTTSQHEAPEILRPLVSRLRHKLDGFRELENKIVSVRGTGYVFEGEIPV
jgi:DNA-binding response OmpR family regulator